MLKAFREHLKSKRIQWILWGTIGTFVVAIFAVWGGGTQGSGVGTSAVAAFGSYEVGQRDFQRAYERRESQLRSQWGEAFTPDLARQMGLARQTIDSLVAAHIFVEEAEKLGLEATDEEVREIILGIPGLTEVDGTFVGQETYENLLRRGAFGSRYTPAEFEAEIAEQILIDKLIRVLGGTTFVSDAEIEEAYRERVERAKIRWIALPGDRFADEITVAEEDLQAHFQENLQEYELPERRVVDYVLIEPALLRAEIEIPDADVRAYYDANQDEFTRPTRVQARHIFLQAGSDAEKETVRVRLDELKARLESGEDFAALARESSQDEATRESGGDLGLFERGRYSPALEEAAFAAQVGDLVGPVESALITGTGYHLIEVQAREEGGVTAFEEVAPGIRSRLQIERSRTQAETEAAALAAGLEAEGALVALRDYAAEHAAARFETTEPFGRDDNVPGIGRATMFTVNAFDLELNGTSQPFEIAGGWAVLRVSEIQESRLPSLDEVRTEVEQAVRTRKQEAAAAARLEATLADLRGGQTLDEAAAALDLEAQESSEFSRTGSVAELGAGPELAEAVFALEPGQFGGPVDTIDGPVVFEVTEITRMDPILLEEETPALRETLMQQKVDGLLSSIARERRAEKNMVIFEDRLAALGVIDPPSTTGTGL